MRNFSLSRDLPSYFYSFYVIPSYFYVIEKHTDNYMGSETLGPVTHPMPRCLTAPAELNSPSGILNFTVNPSLAK